MSSFLWAGVVLGLSAGLIPGPLLVLVVSQSLRLGTAAGMKVAATPLITDMPIALVSFTVLTQIASVEPFFGILSIAGAIFLFCLSWQTFSMTQDEFRIAEGRRGGFADGLFLNVVNPYPYLFWVTIGGPTLVDARVVGWPEPIAFLLSFYGSLVGSKMWVAWLVGKRHRPLGSCGYLIFVRSLGAALLIFALLFVRDAWTYWTLK